MLRGEAKSKFLQDKTIMAQTVHILGAGCTDFRRNALKEGVTLGRLIVEAARSAIADAGIEPRDIQAGVVGNFASGLFTHQLHLGALLTDADPALRGIPTIHVEAACASGAAAVLTAAQLIAGGIHEVILVVGAEQQKTMSPLEGAEVLGAAAEYKLEREEFGEHLFPKLFAWIARLYMQRYRLTDEQLAKVAVKNRAHAMANPLAQMRDEPLTVEEAVFPSDTNSLIAPPLKISDCSPISDGAAAVVLCSGEFLARLTQRATARLLGYGQSTDTLALARKDPPDFPVAVRAVAQAYKMAQIGPKDLQGAEVHDCFTISEIVACELLGLAEPGKSAALLESGVTALPAARARIGAGDPPYSLPVNPSGGLIGAGHPVGATGVRQIVEAQLQLTERATGRQISGARRFLAFNIGGTFTTNVVTIWERAD